MEVKVVISLDDATQEIIKDLTAVLAVRGLSKAVRGEDKAVKETTEISDVENISTKDFVEEIDEIDAKREAEAKKTKKTTSDAKELTVEDVRAVLATKKKEGFGDDIKAILKKYGVSMVSDLDPEDYAAVIKQVNELK